MLRLEVEFEYLSGLQEELTVRISRLRSELEEIESNPQILTYMYVVLKYPWCASSEQFR